MKVAKFSTFLLIILFLSSLGCKEMNEQIAGTNEHDDCNDFNQILWFQENVNWETNGFDVYSDMEIIKIENCTQVKIYRTYIFKIHDSLTCTYEVDRKSFRVDSLTHSTLYFGGDRCLKLDSIKISMGLNNYVQMANIDTYCKMILSQ